MTDTEQQILSSPFLERIRDLRFDASAYRALTDALERLIVEWADSVVVNKTVAAELFILPTAVRGAASKSRGREAERLELVADDLETLVFRCLVEGE